MVTLKEKVSIDCDKLSQNHLTCASCLEVYDRSLRLPKVLKCYGYHSICKQCLESICSQSSSVFDQSFSCPICREKVEIPAKGVSEFPSNPLLIQLLDLLDDHELVPECPKHPHQEPRYCETCDALFCDLCDKESHSNANQPEPNHSIISAIKAIKEVPKKLSDKADKWISELDEAHKLVALMIENVEQNSGTVLEEIDLIFGKINSLVDNRHEELLTLAREMRENKVEILQDQLQLIENEKTKVTTEFKKFQYRGADGEMKEKIEDLRNRTESMKGLLNPRTNCSIHLTENRIESIQRAIENCGTIQTSETSASLSGLIIGKCFAQMRTLMTILTSDSFIKRHEHNSNCIHATLLGPDEFTNIPLKVTDGKNDIFEVHFIPPQPGLYQIRVTISGNENEDEEYNLKFTVNAHKNSIYESQEVGVDAEVVKKIIPNTETDFMKLMANSLYCEVGEKSSNWAVDSKRAPDPLMDFKPILMKNKQSPLYCRLVDTMSGSRILCATSLDFSKTAWICVEKSSCSQIMLVNPAEESKKWVENSFSNPGRILCMASIPIWGSFSTEVSKIDMTNIKSVKFQYEQSSTNESSSENEYNSTRPSTSNMDHPTTINCSPASDKAEIINPNSNSLSSQHSSTTVIFSQTTADNPTSEKSKEFPERIRENSTPTIDPPGNTLKRTENAETRSLIDHTTNESTSSEKFFDSNSVSNKSIFTVEDSNDIYKNITRNDKKAEWKFSSTPSFSFGEKFAFNLTGSSDAGLFSRQETPQTSPFKSSEEVSTQNIPLVTDIANTTVDANFFLPRYTNTDTLWLGSEDGTIYIWFRKNKLVYCIGKIKLAHSVLKIVHSRNRVFVALANGHCIVFIESLESVLKKSSEYFLINMGEIKKKFDGMRNSSKDDLKSFGSITVDNLTQNAATMSGPLSVDQNFEINCMESVGDTIWLGYQNCVYILECETLRVVFELRINSENARVEHLTNSGGGGVWCCIRLQSHQIIQLISAAEPHQKILAIDIRPELRKLLIPTFTDLELDSLARITALKASGDHLWIGTAAGLVLNIPYALPFFSSKCDLSKTQLSLHGFGGAVKFFLMLNKGILSGGEGYRDLMTDPDAASNGVLNENYPHLIH